MISSALALLWSGLVSVESAGPDPLWLLGPGGDLSRLDGCGVVSVVVSTLGHLVRAGALPVNTRPGPWNIGTCHISTRVTWSVVTKLDHVTSHPATPKASPSTWIAFG